MECSNCSNEITEEEVLGLLYQNDGTWYGGGAFITICSKCSTYSTYKDLNKFLGDRNNRKIFKIRRE